MSDIIALATVLRADSGTADMEERRCRRRWKLRHHPREETEASTKVVVMEDVRKIHPQCFFILNFLF